MALGEDRGRGRTACWASWPSMVDTDFTFEATRSPTSRTFSALAGALSYPPSPFRVDARLVQSCRRHLDRELLTAELGGNTLERRRDRSESRPTSSAPMLDDPRGRAETVVVLRALAGIAHFPTRPWELSGPVRVTETGYELEGIVARVVDTEIRVGGQRGPSRPNSSAPTCSRQDRGPRPLEAVGNGRNVDLPARAIHRRGPRAAGRERDSRSKGLIATIGGVVIEAERSSRSSARSPWQRREP